MADGRQDEGERRCVNQQENMDSNGEVALLSEENSQNNVSITK